MLHRPLLLLLLLAVAALALSAAAAARGGRSGEEFVKACDSGPDDVTNQCINRIPDDIGVSTGSHACAYHEAEVRCLGLCGNTMTWRVAYQNALKRYRLVCASYIKDRIAEKEEDEGPPPDDDDGRAKPAAPAPPPPPPAPKKAAPAPAKPKAQPAPKPSPSPSPPASPSAKDANKAATLTVRTTVTSHPAATAERAKTERQDMSSSSTNIHAMLPTMDPELAGARARTQALPVLALALAAAVHIA
ncbi:hypothetical protein H4R21_005077 [Coemansia helicoidea]|uniref:Uncharacterized protein n=1 Tax=Coemansia helicoidea TaxID=1286919 RepID=A0ACC1KU77_9FUNG|nr:hypothetical protein H4R21_005077 [Coemansia helicoidea]